MIRRGVPTQDHVMENGEAAPADIGRDLGLPSADDGDAGSGVRRYGGVCAEEV